MISLDSYYQYVKQTMLLTGIQWTMIYRYNEGPKPKLRNLLVEHRDRAWLARPSNVQTGVQGGPGVKFYREKLLKDTNKLSEFIRTRLRGSGSFVGTSVRYELKGGISGRLDAVYQDHHKNFHLYKMTHDIERDKYSDIIWLDYEGFKICYKKPPKYVWFIDLENYCRVRLDKTPENAIIEEMVPIAKLIRSGAKYKNPGLHCVSCKFNTRCFNAK